MPEAVLLVQQRGNTLIQTVQQITQRHSRPLKTPALQQLGPGRHFRKGKTTAQGNVQSGQRLIGRIHRADNIDIFRHAEEIARIGQTHGNGIPLIRIFIQTRAVRILQQRNEFAENAGNIAPVDLVNNQHIRQ